MERFIGVMVGTSLDGVDVVCAQIGRPFRFSVDCIRHIPFNATVRSELLQVIQSETLPLASLPALHHAVGEMLGETVNLVLKDAGIAAADVRAIGLHGPTLFHCPDGLPVLGRGGRGTFQLGDAHVVRARTGIPTIYDFRHGDMALGGQGAPLVPFLDRLFFQKKNCGRILLNLGGIANATFLPGDDSPVVAFDTGPANMVIDALMRKHPAGPHEFDQDGATAASGKVIDRLLDQCLKHPYFDRLPPKSTGREDFGAEFVTSHFSIDAPHADLVATATQLTVTTVSDAIRRFSDFSGKTFDELIIAGGGVHNRTLLQGLAAALPGLSVRSSGELGMDPDAKEAILMASLAWAFCHNVPGNVPSVTGASAEIVLGAVTG